MKISSEKKNISLLATCSNACVFNMHLKADLQESVLKI